jgi:putative tryptophan/tyrosine transport system substrate-binding protein
VRFWLVGTEASEATRFLTLLGGAAAWPLAARAQRPAKVPTIGFAGSNASAWTAWTAAFVERLHALGWTEGRAVAIEYRWTEGRPECIAEIAAEFIRLKVDLIVTNEASAAVFNQATSVIPIVFVLGIDPIGDGLVTSLARPGGNVTGLSVQDAEIGGKRLELLHEVVPHLRRLAVMVHVDNRGAMVQMGEVQAAAHALGLEIVKLEIRRAEDIASAFAALKPPPDALYVIGAALVAARMPFVRCMSPVRHITSFAAVHNAKIPIRAAAT